MRNQRGISLLEVLASLTLLSVVLGVAFLLFGSVNSLFSNTAQDYTDKTDVRTAMNTISGQMADATSVRLNSATELRFRTFTMTPLQAKAIVYL
jgi:prepilin-type N-terminal cleavage/methylation domain-containing protein